MSEQGTPKYVQVRQERAEYKPINPDTPTKILNPLGTVVDLAGKALGKLHNTTIVYSTFDYKGNTRYTYDEYTHRLYQKESGVTFIGMGKWERAE